MKLSLFTPTNNPKYLVDNYKALQLQQYDNWEWVIVLNGGAMESDIDDKILDDDRVHVHPGPDTDNIGGLKRYACNLCKSDVFIEYDHDDMLVPGTLPKIAKKVEGGAGFVYSDAAVFEDETLKTWGYNANWGWKHYPVMVYGRRYTATQTFPITPRSLCEVYTAPDHVRAWTRDAYIRAGGHNPDLGVCDDHDLICKTYFSGAEFAHIGDCGYLYRFHPGNTVKARTEEIAMNSTTNRRKYLSGLINEWRRREGQLQIDVAYMVASKEWDPQTTFELDEQDREDAIGHIIAMDVLQHVPPANQADFFNRAYDALLPGGYLTVTVPSSSGKYALQDPRFLTRFNDNSFRYYTDRGLAKLNPEIRCRFQMIDVYDYYPDKFHENYGMKMLCVQMAALKGQWHPGRQQI